MRTVYFDMDGTLANLYGVKDWLKMLRNEDATPYLKAEPLLDLYELAEIMQELRDKKGYSFGVISWLARESSDEYKKKVREAKRLWLAANVPFDFDEIHLIQYGTRKAGAAKDKEESILFDDDFGVCEQWLGRNSNRVAYNVKERHIIDILRLHL